MQHRRCNKLAGCSGILPRAFGQNGHSRAYRTCLAGATSYVDWNICQFPTQPYPILLHGWRTQPGKNELVRREIQKMQEALQAFEVAFKAGETSGFKDSGTKSQGG
jgi:hypothetical protein